MKSKFITILIFLVATALSLVSFDKKDTQQIIAEHQENSQTFMRSADGIGAEKTVTPNQTKENHNILYLPYKENTFANGLSFEEWKEALAFKESKGKYGIVNKLGYMGKYQFGKATLRGLGVNDSISFLEDELLQEKTFIKYVKYNHKQLEPYIKKYSGKTIGGVHVTESGILAAAHLSGAGGVKKFLTSGGATGKRDAFGTSIRSYMAKFGGYDLSHVLTR